MLPADLQIRYDYREGSVPPPDHYEYTIEVSAGGGGLIRYSPDYPGERTPIWEESFTVEHETLERLYQLMVDRGVWHLDWREREDPRVGGELEWMTVSADGNTAAIPGDLEEPRDIAEVYSGIRAVVPHEVWATLDSRRQQYALG